MSGSRSTWTRAVIALGANLGNRARTLDKALAALADHSCVDVVRASSWIRTSPVGGPPQPDFLNGVALVDTTLAPRALLELLLSIEADFGRRRAPGERNAPRELDLDLLLFGDLRVDEDGLVVPHPRLEEREFVLRPLTEVAPDLVLPRSGRTAAERLAELRTESARAR